MGLSELDSADGSVAQWIERLPPEQKVASSSLVGITDKKIAIKK